MTRIAIFASLLLALLLVSESAAVDITCDTVVGDLQPCLPYIIKGSTQDNPSDACCGGIRTLKAVAKTKEDRVQVCNCIKATLKRIPNLDPGRAGGLPKACGVPINPNPSPDMDCSQVNEGPMS
ncbi:hypothetical protein Scep_006035 [Stephania cephalantha]|uniref:Non-specific lipid-transfer protein n=1 Tax=Stephania cephalantha TaxID=152367 RepID=A0AAP0PJQ1_9MAGN